MDKNGCSHSANCADLKRLTGIRFSNFNSFCRLCKKESVSTLTWWFSIVRPNIYYPSWNSEHWHVNSVTVLLKHQQRAVMSPKHHLIRTSSVWRWKVTRYLSQSLQAGLYASHTKPDHSCWEGSYLIPQVIKSNWLIIAGGVWQFSLPWKWIPLNS